MNNVLVTGVGGPAGRAALSYFQERGFYAIGTDMRPLDGIFPFRTIPSAKDSQYLHSLLQVLKEEKIGLLVPTVTEELPVISENREKIRTAGYTLFISPFKGARICNDKWETARQLNRHGINVPLSYWGKSRQKLLEIIPFPILSKPREGRGGRGIAIYQNEYELPEVLSPDLVYQEFLAGEEFDVNLFAKSKGKTEVSVALRKTALKSGSTGNALSVERVIDEPVTDLAEKAVRALALEGPLDIDIRKGPNGEARILEINARLGANVRTAEEVLDAMVKNWR